MSRAGAKAKRKEALAERVLVALFEHGPRCPMQIKNYDRVAEGDRPHMSCTCRWDERR